MKYIKVFLIYTAILFASSMDAQVILISDGGVVNSCSGTIYDSGGFGDNYQSNEDYSITVCSNDPTMCLTVEGSFFLQDDDINLYDGLDTSAPLVFNASGNSVAGPFIMTSGCFILDFQSNSSDNGSGFELNFDCISDCSCTNANDPSLGGSAGNDASICAMEYQLQASLNSGYTGTWSSDQDVVFSDSSNPTTTVTSNVTGPTTLVWSMNDGGSCFLEDIIEIYFSEIQSNLSTTDAICDGICDGTAEVTGTTGGLAPYDCNWSIPSASVNSCSQENICAGDYTVTISDSNNCTEVIDFTIAQSSSLLIQDITGVDETCKGICDGEIEISSSGASQFSIDGGVSFFPNNIFTDVCNGDFQIVVKDIDNCIATGEFVISYPAPPIADFSVVDQSASIFDPIFQMNNSSTDAVSYLWEFGYPFHLNISNEENPVFILNDIDVGNYQIMLIVEDATGCVDSTFKIVNIHDDLLVYVPNSFSPNQDGLNDIFRPILSDVDQDDYLFAIYDRYGREIFKTIDIKRGWNGESSEDYEYYLADGVYTWLLEFKSISSSERTSLKGSVSIVR